MGKCQKLFEKYILLNHKEKLERFVRDKIEEAKGRIYYEAGPSPVSYDCSLSLHRTTNTIGEMCIEDYQVLCASTGDQRPTYISGYGLYAMTVGDEIESELNDIVLELAYLYVDSNYDRVYKELSEETDVEEGISSKELTEYAVEYGILLTMFSLLESIHDTDGLLCTLLKRNELTMDNL